MWSQCRIVVDGQPEKESGNPWTTESSTNLEPNAEVELTCYSTPTLHRQHKKKMLERPLFCSALAVTEDYTDTENLFRNWNWSSIGHVLASSLFWKSSLAPPPADTSSARWTFCRQSGCSSWMSWSVPLWGGRGTWGHAGDSPRSTCVCVTTMRCPTGRRWPGMWTLSTSPMTPGNSTCMILTT